MIRLNENVAINIKNRSYSATAEIEVPDAGVDGAILAQGGRTGGWAFFAEDGKLGYHYNFWRTRARPPSCPTRRSAPAPIRYASSSPTREAESAKAAS